jgi:hypothetical protein
MKRKKSMGENFSWPFSKHRQQWIETADEIAQRVGEERASIESCEWRPPKCRSRYVRFAKNYSLAASYYRSAGLGLAARLCYRQAIECWKIIESRYEDDENAPRNIANYTKKAEFIETYWESDE